MPSAGAVDHFFDDELVPASRGVQPEMLRKIEPFPTTKELVPYNAGFLSGWVVERYQIDLVAAAKTSRDQMDAKMYALCAAQVPGDTHRNLQVEDDYSGQTFKHILTPDLAADLQLRRAQLSRWSSTATPARSPANIPRAG